MKKILINLLLVFSALAVGAQCVPLPPDTTPIISILGRELTFSNVSINGGGNYANLTAGSLFTVSFDFVVSTNISACPGCVTFFYVGVAGTSAPASPSATTYPNTDCIGSVFGGQTGSHTANFTAPAAPGYYYITMDATWTYWCHQYAITHSNCLGRAIALVAVGNPPLFKVTLDSVNNVSSCGGSDGEIFITPTGGAGCYKYSWSVGSTTQNLTNASEGFYSVTVADGICDTVLSGTISAPGFGFSLPSDTALCDGDSLLLNVTIQHDSLRWQDGSSAVSYLITSPGTYWVEIFAGLCSERDSIDVLFHPQPTPFLGNDTVLCEGEMLTLDVGSGFDSVLWQDGMAGNSYAVTANGNYSVEVSLNSCLGRDTVMVDFEMPPNIDIGNDTNICEGGSVTFDATTPGGSYFWQDGSMNATFTADSSGTYSVVVVAGVCSTGDAAVLTVETRPVIDIIGNDTICSGEIKLLDATYPGASDYLWQDGITSAPTFSASSAGDFWVDISVGACTARDSAEITVNQIPVINLDADYLLCEDDTLILDVSSAGTGYEWQDGSMLPVYYVTTPSTYSVKVFNGSCVSGDTTVVTEVLLPQVDLGEDLEECKERIQVTLDATFPGADYLWSDLSTNAQLVVTTGGIFSVTVTNTCGLATDEVTINAKDCTCKMVFPTAFSPNRDGKNDFFKPITNCAITDFNLSIFNRWGEKVFESNSVTLGWDGTYKDELLELGVYMWRAQYSLQGSIELNGGSQSGSLTLVR